MLQSIDNRLVKEQIDKEIKISLYKLKTSSNNTEPSKFVGTEPL
jgi:hypothetical protein